MYCTCCGQNRKCKVPPEVIDPLLEERDEWVAARRAISRAQSYTIGPRSLTRANLGEIRKMIKDLDDEIDNLCQYGTRRKPSMRVRRVVPMDV